MSFSEEKAITIIGAGPAGLATALGLSNLKTDICCLGPVVISHSESPDTRTIALFQGSIEFMRNLGVFEDVKPYATSLKTIRIMDDTRRLIRAPEAVFRAGELGLETFGYNIPNAVLTAKLYEALVARRPGCYQETSAVEALESKGDRVIVKMKEGRSLSTRLLIGADGKNSLSRKFANIETKAWQYPQTALVCNFSHELLHEGTSNEFHTESGPCTTVPLSGNNSSLVLVEKQEEINRLNSLGDEEFARELEKRLHGILGEVTAIGKRAQFPLSGLTAGTFAKNRVALVGEAGHVIPPIGAQGLNLGFRDAAAIIEILGKYEDRNTDPGSDMVLNEYNNMRRMDIWSRTLTVDLLNRTLLNGLLPVQLVRSGAVGLINRIGPLRRFLMRQGIQPGFTLPSLMLPDNRLPI